MHKHLQFAVINHVNAGIELLQGFHLRAGGKFLHPQHQRLFFGTGPRNAVHNSGHIGRGMIRFRAPFHCFHILFGVVHVQGKQGIGFLKIAGVRKRQPLFLPLISHKIKGGNLNGVKFPVRFQVVEPQANVKNFLKIGVGIAHLKIIIPNGNAVQAPPG